MVQPFGKSIWKITFRKKSINKPKSDHVPLLKALQWPRINLLKVKIIARLSGPHSPPPKSQISEYQTTTKPDRILMKQQEQATLSSTTARLLSFATLHPQTQFCMFPNHSQAPVIPSLQGTMAPFPPPSGHCSDVNLYCGFPGSPLFIKLSIPHFHPASLSRFQPYHHLTSICFIYFFSLSPSARM